MTQPKRSLLTVADLSTAEVDRIMGLAREFKCKPRGHAHLLEAAIVAALFFEPSTRTRLSFEAAAHRLGARVLTVSDAAASSVSKGETLVDTARIVSAYADALIVRHPLTGAAHQMSDVVSVPVINAGDGTGEHPTQALLDLFTIYEEVGEVAGRTVTFLGDLRYGRTVHSLARLLAARQCHMRCVAPKGLELPRPLFEELRDSGADVQDEEFGAALAGTDVIYVTRIQKERFVDPRAYEEVRGTYRLDAATLQTHAPQAVVLHPLPRVDEIASDVDALPRAAYFRQAANGVPVRMAILSLLLKALPW